MSYPQPQPQNSIEFRKDTVRRYSRNAVIRVGSDAVGGAVLELLAGSMSLFLILAIVGLVGGLLDWQKVQQIINYKGPQQMPAQRQLSTEPVHIDAQIWTIKLLKTRSLVADAYRGGHVKVDGGAMKPSTLVVPGDRVRL